MRIGDGIFIFLGFHPVIKSGIIEYAFLFGDKLSWLVASLLI
jgi:hypothetical protein